MTRPPRPPKRIHGAALIIIDMMNPFDFEDGRALAAQAESISKNILRLREYFDGADLPVVYVNDNFMHWKADFREIVTVCTQDDAVGASSAVRLAPVHGHYHVLKPKHSGFLATPLDILLRKLGVSSLIITGIAADSCVLATAQDAKMREYDLWIPYDCVASITPVRKRNALALMKTSLGADTRSTRGAMPDYASGSHRSATASKRSSANA